LVEKLQSFFNREVQSIHQQATARLYVDENLRGEVAEIMEIPCLAEATKEDANRTIFPRVMN
jgi:hypothetical protein